MKKLSFQLTTKLIKQLNCLIILFFVIPIQVFCQNFPTTRDPLKWPFSSTSIWNIPIGSNAKYIHAKIEKANSMGLMVDEDIIILKKDARKVKIYTNTDDWSGGDRCSQDGVLLFEAPIPNDFIVNKSTWEGLTPNSGLAVLMSDGITIKQTQPFARCIEAEIGTSHYTFDDQNIYGEGYYGAHGGSGLSALGGTLRLNELLQNSGPIYHTLKISLYGAKNYYYDNVTQGYRWPAKTADNAASNTYGTLRTNSVVSECLMGALLALPLWMNLDSLGFETIPGKILAQAFQHYGAYIVDDAAWDVYQISTEWSPDGRFKDNFKSSWGFEFNPSNKNLPWSRDMDRIFLNLHIVDNNSINNIGGGGTPSMPYAPTIAIGTELSRLNTSDYSISPDPASKIINITCKESSNLSIIDLQGKRLINRQLTVNKNAISISDIQTGIYIIEITNNSNRMTRELIIK